MNVAGKQNKNTRAILGWTFFAVIFTILTVVASYPLREPMTIAALKMLDPAVIIGIVGGSIIGLIIGALPGVSPVTAIAVLMPLTFGWESDMAMYFLVSILASSLFAGAVPAILLNTPGDPPNAATCFDGYPMARKGEGGRALGIAAMASLVGSILGVMVLVMLLPVVRPVVLAFSAPEFFWLAMLALVAVAFAIQSNLLKGIFAGGLGVLIALIGYSNVLAVTRFTGGSYYLYDGLELAPLVMGIIALSEMYELHLEGGGAMVANVKSSFRGIWRGCLEVFKYPANFTRATIIGVVIGIMPGVGGTAAAFISYGSTVSASKHPQTFGRGDPEGIMSPQIAITAERGGALLPTVAFGIPGSTVMALMLGALMLHGIVPGPLMVRDHMDVIWALIWGLFIAGVGSTIIGLFITPLLIRLTGLKTSYMIPIIIVLCAAGSYVIRGTFLDVLVVLLAGIFGYGLSLYKFPLICFVMGYILGTLAETNFLQSLMISYDNYAIFFTRPISIVLIICLVALIAYPLVTSRRNTREVKP